MTVKCANAYVPNVAVKETLMDQDPKDLGHFDKIFIDQEFGDVEVSVEVKTKGE